MSVAPPAGPAIGGDLGPVAEAEGMLYARPEGLRDSRARPVTWSSRGRRRRSGRTRRRPRTVAYAAGCRPGGHAELWTVADGGHLPVLSAGFARQVVDFLRAHPRPPG